MLSENFIFVFQNVYLLYSTKSLQRREVLTKKSIYVLSHVLISVRMTAHIMRNVFSGSTHFHVFGLVLYSV